jgi:hypothetical protein
MYMKPVAARGHLDPSDLAENLCQVTPCPTGMQTPHRLV